VARSEKYLPGMISALFTCADKLFISLNNVIVGGLVVLAGYRASFPTVNTPYSTELFWVGMICYCGLPALGFIINIICMRFYTLNKEKMAEIQQTILDMKIYMDNDSFLEQ
jgi:Na+/melibiose symporter-like transporter